MAGIVVALLVVVGVVAVAALGLDVGDDPEPVADQQEATDDGDRSTGTTGDDRPTDDGDLRAPVAQAHRELFADIDAAERAMIALSQDTPPSTTELGEDALAEFRAVAEERAAELERLRDELSSMDTAGSAEVEAIREAYLTHLDDWIDWSRAVAADPSLVDRSDAAAPYFEAINFSADGFANAVERHLDRSAVPDDVRDLADTILERGFSSGEDDGTEI